MDLLHHPAPEVITHALKAIGTLAFDNQAKTSLMDLGIANLALDLAKSPVSPLPTPIILQICNLTSPAQDTTLAFRATELIGHICFSSEQVAAQFLAAGALAALVPLATQTKDTPLRYSAIRGIGVRRSGRGREKARRKGERKRKLINISEHGRKNSESK